MGKELVRIKHAFDNKASLYFGPIVPIVSVTECTRIEMAVKDLID